MQVWEALGMDNWIWERSGTQPTNVLIWVQDHVGMMDLGIWDGSKWTCDNGNLVGEPTHWRAMSKFRLNANTTGHDRLQAVFDVLDDQLGDTDPHTDIPWDEWDDDDLKVEHPLMWCCQQLSEVLGKQPAEKPTIPEAGKGSAKPNFANIRTDAEKAWEQHWSRGF